MSASLTDQLYQLLIEEGLVPERLPDIITNPADEDPLDAAEDEQVHSLRLQIQGKNAEWPCLIRVFEQTKRILIYSVLPLNVAEAQRADLAIMLTQINYGLIIGNFELDLDDGEIRYKTSMDSEGMQLNSTMIRNLFYGNFFSVDLYYHALVQATAGHKDLQQLINQAEQRPDSDPTIADFDLVDQIVH